MSHNHEIQEKDLLVDLVKFLYETRQGQSSRLEKDIYTLRVDSSGKRYLELKVKILNFVPPEFDYIEIKPTSNPLRFEISIDLESSRDEVLEAMKGKDFLDEEKLFLLTALDEEELEKLVPQQLKDKTAQLLHL